MIGGTRKIRIGKRNPPVGLIPLCSRNARSYCANEVPSIFARPFAPCWAIDRPGWANNTF